MKRSHLFPGFFDRTCRLQWFWLVTSNVFDAFRRRFGRFSVRILHEFLSHTFLISLPDAPVVFGYLGALLHVWNAFIMLRPRIHQRSIWMKCTRQWEARFLTRVILHWPQRAKRNLVLCSFLLDMIFRFALKWKPQFYFVLESIRRHCLRRQFSNRTAKRFRRIFKRIWKHLRPCPLRTGHYSLCQSRDNSR